MNTKIFICSFLGIFFCSASFIKQEKDITIIPYLNTSHQWSDSVFNTLSLDEKISQLFMVAAYSNEKDNSRIEDLIKNYHIGGLVFFQGGPVRQVNAINKFQNISKTPLIIAQDAEYGFGMRLDSCFLFPNQMTLGAIKNDSLIYLEGQEIASHAKLLGVQVLFGPVADINNNPNNSVINQRSYGEQVDNVVRKTEAMMKGIQDQNIIATAKHFPGHGDTDADSHKMLPVVNHSVNRLDSVEFKPFINLINNGIGGIMTAHLYVPSLDSTKNMPSTLSHQVMTNILKNQMGFKGLLFTDALNMRGVSAYYKPGEVEMMAINAGNDVLVFPEDVPLAINKIKESIINGRISEEQINEHCIKILRAKEFCGLNKFKSLVTKKLVDKLNTSSSELLNRKLIESSLTLLKNKDNILPLNRLDTLKIATITVGGDSLSVFYKMLKKYASMGSFYLSSDFTDADITALLLKLQPYNLVVVGIEGMNKYSYLNYGINENTSFLLQNLSAYHHKFILDIFGNPYALEYIFGCNNADAIIVSYQETDLTLNLSAQLIMGGIPALGSLPVSVGKNHAGKGIIQPKTVRFKYTVPLELGISEKDLAKIDSIAMGGIKDGAYPGCQIFIAQKGKVFYQKSFGKYMYNSSEVVTDTSIYDLASITKIGASTASIMRLQSEGKFSLDYSLCDYIPEVVGDGDFMNMKLREILSHQAGLPAWIPFYIHTLKNGVPLIQYFSMFPSEHYPVRVANNLYITNNYRDTIYSDILASKLGSHEYKYSDLGYYFILKIIEKITGQKQNDYVDETFYKPLGLQTMGYLPTKKHPLLAIVPTENDNYFRHQLIWGDVHDPGAAMLGGVGGHAGLFSNANDLGVMMQMFLNGGTYGGQRYIDKVVLDEYTSSQYYDENKNRRGAGFDKPVRTGGPGPTCNCVSFDSFGHTGFTGTIAWADPDKEVVYIFLSNRVYPTAENRKLITSGQRTQIQRAIYNAINHAEGE